MRTWTHRGLFAVAALATGAAPVFGSVEPGRYILGPGTTFSHGCYEPCLCPIFFSGEVSGEMTIGEPAIGDVFDFYPITGIAWTITMGDGAGDMTATGSGTYQVTNFGDIQHELISFELTFTGGILDGQTLDFFSELQPADPRPGISIPVSVNGMFCLDTVFEVVAQPAALAVPVHYTLGLSSSYQQGCHGVCDCLLEPRRRMVGGFDLTLIKDLGTVIEYELDGIDFTVHRAMPGDEKITITGSGTYTIINGIAGPSHEMVLELSINGGDPITFDQELANTTTFFPEIDIALDMGDLECFDIILTLHADPAP